MRYTQHFRRQPHLSPHLWSFSITGTVRHPLIWNWDDIQAYPPVERAAALICAHQPSAPPDPALMFDAVWRGVRLAALLDEIEIDPAVTGATLYAADGYSSNLTLEQLRAAYLIYAIDGLPLPQEHGYPARIIVPELYGYKSPKWIERAHLAADPAPGVWESRGWTAANLRPTLAFDDPRVDKDYPLGQPLTLSGKALTEQPIRAHLHHPNSRHSLPVTAQPSATGTLHEWQVTWTPEIPGDFLIYVSTGDTQIHKVVRIR